MIIKIIAEAHEGVASCDEECIAEIDASSEEEALIKYHNLNPMVIWCHRWNCYLIGVRKIFAKKK